MHSKNELGHSFQALKNSQKRDRDWKRWKFFFKWNIVQPAAIGAVVCHFLVWVAFVNVRTPYPLPNWTTHAFILIVHFLVLGLIYFLFWIPYMISAFETRLVRNLIAPAIFFLRNFLLIFLILILFPYQMVHMILRGFLPRSVIFLVGLLGLFVLGFVIAFSTYFLTDRSTARRAQLPKWVIKAKPTRLQQSVIYVLFVFVFVVVEGWFTALIISGKSPDLDTVYAGGNLAVRQIFFQASAEDFFKLEPPYAVLFEDFLQLEIYSSEGEQTLKIRNNWSFPAKNTREWMRLESNLIAWACISLISTFLMLAFGGFSSRIMTAVLPVATQQSERLHLGPKEIILKADIYAKNFRDFLAGEYAFSVLGGFFGTLVYLGLPIVFHASQQFELITSSFNEDTAFFAVALIAAWLGPVIVALYKIDDTFGKYFNSAIANLIMDIRTHAVYVGYGDIGRRVVEKDIRLGFTLDRENTIRLLVTPDLLPMRVYHSAIVIDTSDKEFVYAAENDLLGRYGVVAVEDVGGMRLKRLSRISRGLRKIFPSLRRRFQYQYAEKKRILVPAIKGAIEEPFVSARANLERARLLVSTIPSHRDVNVIFNLARDEKIKAILCITRSDHMTSLTYRTSVRPVVLVYPTALQGAVFGRRLWAAALKMAHLRNFKIDTLGRPRIYIIGSNKLVHYMLENFWMSRNGKPKDKAQWIADRIINVHLQRIPPHRAASAGTAMSPDHLEGPPHGPFAPRAEDPKEFTSDYLIKLHFPMRFGSGRRYPRNNDVAELLQHIPQYIVHDFYPGIISDLFQKYAPDVILINTEDPERNMQLFMQILRALERMAAHPSKNKSGTEAQFNYPLILLSQLTHSKAEQIMLGDTSLFYKKTLALYYDQLFHDRVYPEPASWDREEQRLQGETIIDAKEDVEEMILGIERSLFRPLPGARGLFLQPRKTYMEINTCTVNIPGSLASLVALLAGERYKASKYKEKLKALPSFQNLRAIMLDPLNRVGLITGYMVLTPAEENNADEKIPPPQGEDAQENDSEKLFPPPFIRMYAVDGNRFSGINEEKQLQRAMEKFKKHPTAPGILRFLHKKFEEGHTSQAAELPETAAYGSKSISENPFDHQITIEQFRNVLLDPDETNKKQPGPCACAGMSTCPIATYQDYVVATNEIHAKAGKDGDKTKIPIIKEAPYYICVRHLPNSLKDLAAKQAEQSEEKQLPSARIMVCVRSEEDRPGRLAFVLNTLLLKKWKKMEEGPRFDNSKSKEWVFNIQHLTDQPCHNRLFNLNRAFGFWEARNKRNDKAPQSVEIQLVEILPLGTGDIAREWCTYAKTLFAFLNSLDNGKNASGAEGRLQRLFGFFRGRQTLDKGKYKLICFDNQGNKICGEHCKAEAQDADAASGGCKKVPAALIILRRREKWRTRRRSAPVELGDYELCSFCGMQGRSHSCEKWRPWTDEKALLESLEGESKPANEQD